MEEDDQKKPRILPVRWAKLIILAAVLGGLYILAIRPIRGVIIRRFIYPEAIAAVAHKTAMEISDSSTGGFEIAVGEGTSHSGYYRYFMAFGEYLFVPFIFLAILRADTKWAVLIFLLHFGYFIVETGLLFLGLRVDYVFLRAMDLLGYILFPTSFGIVALAWFETREERKADSMASKNSTLLGRDPSKDRVH